MFLTVTLNPALDKTLFVEHNTPQDTLRATRAIDLAGGKGVNVSRALMPLGGHPGAHVADLARAEGIEVAGVPVSGQTRTALTIQDAGTGQYWHYLEPGPNLTDQEVSRFREGFLWAADGCHTVTISGSLPSPSAAPLVAWIARTARERDLRLVIDTFSPLIRSTLEAGAWLVKPTRSEWESTFGEELDTDAARWRAVERMAGWGTRVAVLSLGAEGALAVADGERYRVIPPRIVEVNDLGSGDAMVAGICWAGARGLGVRECLAWGAACGAASAAVWDPCGITRAEVERLLPQVEIRVE